MAIAVSAGTTTSALAQRLANVAGLTVVTNSIPVADVLHQRRPARPDDHPDRRRAYAIGRAGRAVGRRRPRTVHVDLVFLGVHGMDPRSGFTCPNLLEADTDRALIEAGRRLVVVADHTKWGVVGISSIVRLDQADVLITDAGLSPDARVMLAAPCANSSWWTLLGRPSVVAAADVPLDAALPDALASLTVAQVADAG